MPIDTARDVFEQGMVPWVALTPQNLIVHDLTVPGATGPLRARLFRPSSAKPPLIVFVHGGGWTFGSIESHQNEMRYLALATGCAVLGFNYRLGPEAPFPAPLDDVVAVLDSVRAGALGDRVDTARLVLAGDSAGANLTLGALLVQRDADKPLPRAAGLFYGCFAPNFDTESHRLFGDGSFGLTTARMRWYWSNFTGTADKPPPLAAPLSADFAGLPPLYLMAAGLDPLRDDTLALAERLKGTDVEHRVVTVPGVIHGFLGRTPRLPVAQAAMVEAGAFLAEKLEI